MHICQRCVALSTAHAHVLPCTAHDQLLIIYCSLHCCKLCHCHDLLNSVQLLVVQVAPGRSQRTMAALSWAGQQPGAGSLAEFWSCRLLEFDTMSFFACPKVCFKVSPFYVGRGKQKIIRCDHITEIPRIGQFNLFAQSHSCRYHRNLQYSSSSTDVL